MKKFYSLLSCLFFLTLTSALFGQAIQLDDNHNLSGFPFNGKLFLRSDRDSTFWESNGTAVGTLQFSTAKSDDVGYTVFNNKIYFAGMDAANGTELWSTNGTGTGTVMVNDLWIGPDSSKPREFIVFNSKLYFTAYEPTYGRELYEYTGSGTPARISDLNPNAGSSFDSSYFAALNNVLYFDAVNGTGEALYGMQGTTITKILDLPTGFKVKGYSKIGTTIFCAIGSQTSGMKIYKTTGVAAASLVKDFSNMFAGITSPQMMNWNNKIYFTVAETLLDNELWSTDGTTTAMVADINPGTNGSNPIILNSVVLQNKLVFLASIDASGYELWTTDGTAGGTSMLKDLNTNPGEGSNAILFPAWNSDLNKPTPGGDLGLEGLDRTLNYNGYIFFAADDGTNGIELYKTDGTAGNTSLVEDINPSGDGMGGSFSYIYTSSGLVFSGNDGVNGDEPWISDGTTATPIVNINLSGDSGPGFFYIWNGDIYLSADDGDGGPDGYRDLYILQGPYNSLPVTLSEFKASVTADHVLLNWSTATENNADHFTVMRSTDGEHFDGIGDVAATGNSNTRRDYSLVDNDAYNLGVNQLYYRLNTKDKDGRSYLSRIVTATLVDLPVTLRIYPNPVHDLLKVKYNAPKGGVMSIVDLAGKIFYRSTISPSTLGMQQINTSAYPSGTYILKFVQNGKATIQKFVKQ